MNTEEIRDFVKTRFALPASYALNNDTSFLASGVVDSTGILELVSFLQEKYRITIDDAEVVPENFDTIDRLVAFVSHKTLERDAISPRGKRVRTENLQSTQAA